MLEPTFAMEILLDGPYPALWDSYTKPEVMRFLKKRGKDIPAKDLSRLMKAILAGPARDKYRKMSDDDWAEHSDHPIWLRLTKLKQSGVQLPKYAQTRLDKSERKYSWKLQSDGSEEFSFFLSEGWRGREEKAGGFLDFGVMSTEEFSKWSKKQTGRWDSDGGWVPFCTTQPRMALQKLQALSEQDEWPIAPWCDALRWYSDNKDLPERHHKETASILVGIPNESMAKLAIMAARWLEKVRPALTKKLLWQLWEKIWKASHIEPWEGKLDFDMTLNHAGGILAAVLMDGLGEFYPTIKAGENPGLPSKLRLYFNWISEGESSSARFARTRLAGNLLYLFRVDQAWTTETFLRRMDLADAAFQPSLWEAYLWSPRIQPDLLVPLKPLFLKVLDDLEKISDRVQRTAVQLFIVIAVPTDRGFSVVEAKDVLYSLPADHLAEATRALKDMLRDAGQKAPTLWRDAVSPWLTDAWPTHPNAKSHSASEHFAWMAMEAGDAFPEAVETVEKFLVPKNSASTLYQLEKLGLHSRFPEAALTLIERLVGDQAEHADDTLLKLLKGIAEAKPRLSISVRYKRLLAIAQ